MSSDPRHAPERPVSSGVRRRRRLVAAIVAIAVVGGGGGWAAVAITDANRHATSPSDAPNPAGTSGSSDTTTASGGDRSPGGSSPSKAQLAIDSSLPADVVSQLEYARKHWKSTSSDEYGYLDDNDCVNFASQTLIARGWQPDDDWYPGTDGDAYDASDAWRSSTALRDYLADHPERATALTDDQRDLVKPGDIVQFDWDDSGDRDHTGIVTAVEHETDGTIEIYYAGHTDATWDRSVDYAIGVAHPGGVASYWSITG